MPNSTAPSATAPYARIPQIELAQLLTGASEFQVSILKDGEVTLSEYESAFLGLKQCILDAGYSFYAGPTLTALMDFDYKILYPPGEVDSGKRAHEQCRREFTDRVDMAWSSKTFADQERILASAKDRLLSCLRTSGIQVADTSGLNAARRDNPDSFYVCLFAIQSELNLPGWGGT